jgi:hypothetical protein
MLPGRKVKSIPPRSSASTLICSAVKVLTQISAHLADGVPNLYVSVVAGTMSEFTSALKTISSVLEDSNY